MTREELVDSIKEHGEAVGLNMGIAKNISKHTQFQEATDPTVRRFDNIKEAELAPKQKENSASDGELSSQLNDNAHTNNTMEYLKPPKSTSGKKPIISGK